ncbi:MAG: NAD(P)/FAD-dependent oxidoreductase [bacterium]|nr:NAD(P)/FAD-dependent oxidoreductase [bacterium]
MISADKNIKILGSGPSGMAAAINLAKDGRKVTVYEKNDIACAKFNNGWQILENYSSPADTLDELREMNIEPAFFHKANSEIDFYDHKLKKYHLKGIKPFGYFIKRGSEEDALDQVLHKTALDSGVEIKYGTVIRENEADIIAGGSRFATGISKEIVFESETEDTLITILDNIIAPKGFAYLFIINGRGTIGTAILRDFKNIDLYSEYTVLRLKQILKFDMSNIRDSVSSVNYFIPNSAEIDNRLYAGEAAGFQDYLFGLGIRRSIQSGYLAARSIIEQKDYNGSWKEYFGNQFESGILNRYLCEKAGQKGYSLLLRIASRMDFQKLGYKLQNPSYIRNSLKNMLMPLLKTSERCKHGDRCTWCRIT